jgi:hypothetical protein
MFSRQNPTGWLPGDILTAAQINGIDINQSRALDGTGGSAGSAYTPATPINIGGSGLILSGTGAAQWIQMPALTLTRLVSWTDIIWQVPNSTPTYWTVVSPLNTMVPPVIPPGSYMGGAMTAPPSETSVTESGLILFRLVPPCDGAVLNSLTIGSNENIVSGTPTATSPATYQVFSNVPASQTSTALSAVVNDAHTGVGPFSPATTAVPLTTPTAIDTSTEVFALYVTNAWALGGHVQIVLSYIQTQWSITTLQPA